MKKLLILFAVLIVTASGSFAVGVNPEAIIQYNSGIDYYKEGNYDGAITAFRSAIKIDPTYVDAYYNLGSVLEYTQQYEAALAVFKQVIVRQPNDYDSVYKAAWLSVKLGQYDKAKSYLGIIPPTCPRGKDAQMLGAQLDLGAQKNQSAAKPTVSQSSELLENIKCPTGVTSDSKGNIYVAEFNDNAILKITPDGKRVILVKSDKISGPMGLACDKNGNIYVANYNKNNVLKISSLGEITVLIGNVKKPYCLYLEGSLLYISCQESNSVLKYRL